MEQGRTPLSEKTEGGREKTEEARMKRKITNTEIKSLRATFERKELERRKEEHRLFQKKLEQLKEKWGCS